MDTLQTGRRVLEQGLPLRIRLVLAAVLVLVYAVVSMAGTPSADFEACATTGTVPGREPQNYWSTRIDRHQAVDAAVLSRQVGATIAGNRQGSLKRRESAVDAGRDLPCVVHTYLLRENGSKEPVSGVRVVLAARSIEGVKIHEGVTDAAGNAVFRPMIPKESRGTAVVIAVSVYADGWSNSDYAWFIPE